MSNELGDPRRWHHETFGDPVLASAGLDRLFHNAHVLVITGPSFRARDRAKDLSVSAATPLASSKKEAPN